MIKCFEINNENLVLTLDKKGILFKKILINGINFRVNNFNILVKNKNIFSLPLDFFFEEFYEIDLSILKLFNIQSFPKNLIEDEVKIEITFFGKINTAILMYEEIDFPSIQLHHFKNFNYFTLLSDSNKVSFNLNWILKSNEIYLNNKDIKSIKIFFDNQLFNDYSIITNLNFKKIYFDYPIDYSKIKNIKIEINFYQSVYREIKLLSPIDNSIHLDNGNAILVYPNYQSNQSKNNNINNNEFNNLDYLDYLLNNI